MPNNPYEKEPSVALCCIMLYGKEWLFFGYIPKKIPGNDKPSPTLWSLPYQLPNQDGRVESIQPKMNQGIHTASINH